MIVTGRLLDVWKWRSRIPNITAKASYPFQNSYIQKVNIYRQIFKNYNLSILIFRNPVSTIDTMLVQDRSLNLHKNIALK